jgi:KUP system potassium uptake protein
VFRVRIYYGYDQQPNIPDALAFCRSQGLAVDMNDTSFFLSREHMVSTPREGMARWRDGSPAARQLTTSVVFLMWSFTR